MTALKDPDTTTQQLAEHALWSIWLRSGERPANEHLCRGCGALDRREVDEAIEHFTQAARIDPQFSEAYNQRAIALCLKECYDESIEDCRRAVELMPCHFGAWAGMGHCHAHLGRLTDAVHCYEKALDIHPHLEGVRDSLTELRRQLGR